MHNNYTKRHGIVFVISGPSGAGKSTICKEVLFADKNLHFSVSCTTRLPREGEKGGTDYNFISTELFNNHISNDSFIEYAEVHGNYYGTLRIEVEQFVKSGQDVLLEIDVQGVSKIQESVKNDSLHESFHFIFIGPPSIKELEHRLRTRATDSETVINKRLHNSGIELESWKYYDYLVINNDLDDAVKKIRTIIQAERLKSNRISEAPWE